MERENRQMDPYEIILFPLMTESSSLMVEKENKLVFVVSLKATKPDVKKAVEKLYEVKVLSVNVQITPGGEKKAYVKLTPDFKAADVAIKLGLL
jgi:large subunit ribosomal protein L23